MTQRQPTPAPIDPIQQLQAQYPAADPGAVEFAALIGLVVAGVIPVSKEAQGGER